MMATPQKPSTAKASNPVTAVATASPKIAEQAGKLIRQLTPVFEALGKLWDRAAPLIAQLLVLFRNVRAVVPDHVFYALFGFASCFFGGAYWMALAAIEVFHLSLGAETKAHLADLWQMWSTLYTANKKDDAVDANNDGVPDTAVLPNHELLTRKLLLLFRTVDTARVTSAVSGLARVGVAVLGALQSQFARTLALSASVGDLARKPVASQLTPVLHAALPAEYHKWIPTVVEYTCKAVACAVCWRLQMIMSTVQAAIKGGLTCSRAVLELAKEKKLTTLDINETMLDEYVGWALAALGLYFQLFVSGGALMFPFNIILFPLAALNYLLSWFVFLA